MLHSFLRKRKESLYIKAYRKFHPLYTKKTEYAFS